MIDQDTVNRVWNCIHCGYDHQEHAGEHCLFMSTVYERVTVEHLHAVVLRNWKGVAENAKDLGSNPNYKQTYMRRKFATVGCRKGAQKTYVLEFVGAKKRRDGRISQYLLTLTAEEMRQC